MALARRTRGAEGFIWPGFVDGLATLLVVVIFVLMVFFLIQMNLAQRVSGQDASLDRLRAEMTELAELLNLERLKSGDLAASNQQLLLRLDESRSEVAGLESRIESLERNLAEAGTESDALRRQLAERDEELGASREEILALTQSSEALRAELRRLEALLDVKEAEAREAKEVSENLTQRLNEALAGRVVELQRFRSEFFGRLREVLQGRSDIRIVGDRFVFQSEVLFDLGSADIGPEGEAKLLELGDALREIAEKIPTDIDWVLQVSGHTDNLPIRTPRYRDNWDLSTERAISVIRYLMLSGIEPERLSATGFGEYQPIDTNDTAEGRARNRRIEFKLTRH